MRTAFCFESQKKEGQLEGPGVGGTFVLEPLLGNVIERCGLDLSG